MIKISLRSALGFTIVELSIVLVIIGLLVGGVLVGQDMIDAAKARSLVLQIQNYNAGVVVFQSKYDYLPGDFNKAIATFGGSRNGDGNGAVTTAHGSAGESVPSGQVSSSQNEVGNFFEHLSKSGLIEGTYVDTLFDNTVPGNRFPIPKNGTGGLFAYTNEEGKHRWYIAAFSGGGYFNWGNNLIEGTGALTPYTASFLDRKMDDGKANAGNVIAQNQPTQPASSASGCIQASDASQYAITKTKLNCRLNMSLN